MKLVLGHASIAREGERASGDAVLVRVESDRTLVCMIDALGHGAYASDAAQAAVDFLRAADLALPISQLVGGVHSALRGSRGAAALVLVAFGDRVRGVSVGNVALRARTAAPFPFANSPGVLGGSLRRIRVFDAALHHGDRLICFTDGVSGVFPIEESSRLRPSMAARAILTRFRLPHDDASILVADVSEVEDTVEPRRDLA